MKKAKYGYMVTTEETVKEINGSIWWASNCIMAVGIILAYIVWPFSVPSIIEHPHNPGNEVGIQMMVIIPALIFAFGWILLVWFTLEEKKREKSFHVKRIREATEYEENYRSW
jgi:hypothetical protein